MWPFDNIQTKFLPVNCTAVVQPCDQGVIRSFKSHYRRLVLQHVFDASEVNPDFQIAKDLKLIEALHFIDKTWKTVHPNVIINSFISSGLTLRPLLLIEEEPTLFEHDFSDDVDERMLADELAEVDYNSDEVS